MDDVPVYGKLTSSCHPQNYLLKYALWGGHSIFTELPYNILLFISKHNRNNKICLYFNQEHYNAFRVTKN